ncbi:hypothetical protein [Streptomyces flavofungini]|uniref:hypothetical protein n=1 Tax=Streptomyces flavofungini TaxID=68200 RepID=UPI0034DFA533
MSSYSIGRAAGLLGVSLARCARERAAGSHPVREAVPTSVRDSFAGIVTAVIVDAVAAQVEIQCGPHRVMSLMSTWPGALGLSGRAVPRAGRCRASAVRVQEQSRPRKASRVSRSARCGAWVASRSAPSVVSR